jgi:hypothetical protein
VVIPLDALEQPDMPRIRPVPVSVAGRRVAADAEGRTALVRSRRPRRSDSRGRHLIGSLRGDSIPR